MDLNKKLKEKKLKYLLLLSVIAVVIIASTFIGWSLVTSEKEIKVIIINAYNNETWIDFLVMEAPNKRIPLAEDINNLSYGESYAYHIKFDKSHKILGVFIKVSNSSNPPLNFTNYKPYADYIYWFPKGQYYDLIAVIAPAPAYNVSINPSNNASYIIEETISSRAVIIFTKIPETLTSIKLPISP